MFNRIVSSLKKSRDALMGKLNGLLGRGKIDDDLLEDLEEILLGADIGFDATEEILDDLRQQVQLNKMTEADEIVYFLRDELAELLEEEDTAEFWNPSQKPYIIMVVGVNGVGKTTSIGKMAYRFRKSGKKVLIASCDTFRAAADEQLGIWAERADVDIVRSQSGADPASVAFDTVNKAQTGGYDVLIIDTAGRLHTRHNLMQELKKISRVVDKKTPGAPHEILLTLDATTGQNGLIQSEKFNDALNLTGLILTKLDSTARGGIVLAIRKQLGIPLRLVGTGEKIDNIDQFDPKAFAEGILESSEPMDD
ncbi:MAG: signal recognition particle-docking protein FtsY [Candidatus Zixiibacteriota bacterium]